MRNILEAQDSENLGTDTTNCWMKVGQYITSNKIMYCTAQAKQREAMRKESEAEAYERLVDSLGIFSTIK